MTIDAKAIHTEIRSGLGTHDHSIGAQSPGLNLAKVARAQQLSTTLRAFDDLAPGNSLVLAGLSNPNHLLRELQLRHPGGFDWNILAEKSKRRSVEIRRRGTAALRNVTEYLEGDHQRLNSMLTELVAAISAGAVSKARKRFAEFNFGMHRHLEAEESVLFPLVENAYGLAIGPKTVMGSEHVEIRRLTDSVATLLQSETIDDCARTARELCDILIRHDMKEEQILYPMADKAIGDEHQRHELVNRMQSL